MSRAGVWLRRLAAGLLLAVVTLAAVTGRAVKDGEQAMAESERAFDEGRLRDAILHARRAAVSYAPGAPHVAASYRRMRSVAIGAEAAGDGGHRSAVHYGAGRD